MNANELADKIEDARNETDFQKWAGQAPDMLRQQQAEIANLKAGLLSHHDIYPVKELTDEEINIVKEAVGNYVCTIKMEIDQEKQTFKGYEHCSNLPSLKSELKDAEQALVILRKAQKR